jgi:hypothetical protein
MDEEIVHVISPTFNIQHTSGLDPREERHWPLSGPYSAAGVEHTSVWYTVDILGGVEGGGGGYG